MRPHTFCDQAARALCQALIKGSALQGSALSSGSAVAIRDGDRTGSTSPARIQYTPEHSQPEITGMPSALSPPKRTFQHTVRGRSPTTLRSLRTESLQDAPSVASSRPAAPNPSPRQSVDLEIERPLASRGIQLEPLCPAAEPVHKSPHPTAAQAWPALVDTYESTQ